MSASPPMTTYLEKPLLFERPDLVINEEILALQLALEINEENFSTLITANCFLALAAHDRKLTRKYFADVMVTAFNFQNRMVRIAELKTLQKILTSGKEISLAGLMEQIDLHMAQAMDYQKDLCLMLKLFKEMRRPEDPVS